MDYAELLEDYKEMLTKYCYAIADVPIRKDENGAYYLDADLKLCLCIMGGHFDDHYVADEIMQGDFPLDGIDKDGYWHFEFLLKYFPGDDEEPSYMEQLLVEPSFCISFEDHDQITKNEDTGSWFD